MSAEFLHDVGAALRLRFHALRKTQQRPKMGDQTALEFKADLRMMTAEVYAQYLKVTTVRARSVQGLRQAFLRACADATERL